jgi:RimJ/RimL family protein N-acetyltransferase
VRVEPVSHLEATRIYLSQWRTISDDSMSPIGWELPSGDECIYLGVIDDDGDLVGIWAIFRHNAALADMHVCFTKKGFGHTALKSGIMALNWLWRYTDFNRIMAQIPVGNRLALKLAQRIGMTQFGINPDSWLKNGKYHDLILMGVTREATTWVEF